MNAFNQKPFEEMTRDEQLLAWKDAKRTLDAAKDAEMSMRKLIVETHFDATQVGTQNIELGQGWKVKAVVKQSYKLDTDAEKVEEVLDTLEDWQAERLVKWSPTLSVSEYKKLSDEDRAAIDKVLTIGFASPTLELVAPKGS